MMTRVTSSPSRCLPLPQTLNGITLIIEVALVIFGTLATLGVFFPKTPLGLLTDALGHYGAYTILGTSLVLFAVTLVKFSHPIPVTATPPPSNKDETIQQLKNTVQNLKDQVAEAKRSTENEKLLKKPETQTGKPKFKSIEKQIESLDEKLEEYKQIIEEKERLLQEANTTIQAQKEEFQCTFDQEEKRLIAFVEEKDSAVKEKICNLQQIVESMHNAPLQECDALVLINKSLALVRRTPLLLPLPSESRSSLSEECESEECYSEEGNSWSEELDSNSSNYPSIPQSTQRKLLPSFNLINSEISEENSPNRKVGRHRFIFPGQLDDGSSEETSSDIQIVDQKEIENFIQNEIKFEMERNQLLQTIDTLKQEHEETLLNLQKMKQYIQGELTETIKALKLERNELKQELEEVLKLIKEQEGIHNSF